MVLFQDEPEEKPSSLKKRSLLEERPTRTRKNEPARAQSLFGDEPSESSRPCGSRSGASANSSSKQPQTVHVDWTTVKLFSSATFLKKTVGMTKSTPAKRPYDNANRSQNAAQVDRTSYKGAALNPGRLKDLKRQPHCKCIVVK